MRTMTDDNSMAYRRFLAATGTDSGDVFDMLPCPFCGGGYQEIHETRVDMMCSPQVRDWSVRCECGGRVDGRAWVYPGEDVDGEIIAEAKRSWNTRDGKAA